MQKKAGKIYFIDKELTDAEVDEGYVYPVWFVVSETIIDEAGEPYEISKHIIYNRNGIKSIFTGSGGGGGGDFVPLAGTDIGTYMLGRFNIDAADGAYQTFLNLNAEELKFDFSRGTMGSFRAGKNYFGYQTTTLGGTHKFNIETGTIKAEVSNPSGTVMSNYLLDFNGHYFGTSDNSNTVDFEVNPSTGVEISTSNANKGLFGNRLFDLTSDFHFAQKKHLNDSISSKLDKVTTSAQSIASAVTFNGTATFNNLTVSTSIIGLIGLGTGNTAVKIETQKITEVYTGAANLTALDLNTNYAECFIVQAPNITTPGIYFRVGSTWRFTSGTLVV